MTAAIVILMLTNAFRQEPLMESQILNARAQARAELLCAREQWSHEAFADSFKGLRYTYAGENLAKGFLDARGRPEPAAVAMAWRKSPSHYRNLTNEKYKYMGLGQSCDLTVQLFSDKV